MLIRIILVNCIKVEVFNIIIVLRMTSEKRIKSELNEIKNSNSEYFTATPIDNNMYRWKASIKGPKESPYEGGIFLLDIEFPANYPFRPPKIAFITKIYHCNINEQGGICLDILKEQWSPALTISKVLLSICSLLDDPNPDDPLMIDIARLYRDDRELHNKNARDKTKEFAMNYY
tara:strand:- start:4 stop:528 length:525 start_codon:yes stop_codon:yes gene_type:complete